LSGEEVQDLDGLMNENVKLEIFPTLLISFYTQNDPELLDKLVMVMRRLFQ
jgi:hypothetical protein